MCSAPAEALPVEPLVATCCPARTRAPFATVWLSRCRYQKWSPLSARRIAQRPALFPGRWMLQTPLVMARTGIPSGPMMSVPRCERPPERAYPQESMKERGWSSGQALPPELGAGAEALLLADGDDGDDGDDAGVAAARSRAAANRSRRSRSARSRSRR